MIKRLLLILITCSLSSCMTHQNRYMTDLDFVYSSIRENHPGIYNDQDPDFCERLDAFYTEAKLKIAGSKGDIDSQKAIIEFTRNFDDVHLGVRWQDTTPKKQQEDRVRKFSTSQLSDGVSWITLPTFDLNSEQGKDFDQVLKNISELQMEQYIIFDLRGNQGGNSDYGSKVINALFGQDYAQQKRCMHHTDVFVDWRASKGNLSHISSLLASYPSSWLQHVERGLKESVDRGEKFYREYSSAFSDFNKKTAPSSAIPAKIIVITDSVNVSAALDFIDELKMMTPHLTLIGQTTKADRVYMEVRSVPLPSGVGTFFFPIKVYRNRPRLDNEPYVPNIEFTDIYNTSALQSFMVTQINEKKFDDKRHSERGKTLLK